MASAVPQILGSTSPAINLGTGEVRQAHIFVATLVVSNYTYDEAIENQNQERWLMADVMAIEFFGRVPQLLFPDSLKAGGSHTNHYKPVLNETTLSWLETTLRQ
jgi:transposase